MFKSAKLIVTTLLLISFAFICMYTNPTQDDYITWTKKTYFTHSTSSYFNLTEVFSQIVGPSLIKECTTSQNYVFFTLYKTQFASDEIQVIGLLNNFFPISTDSRS